MATPVSSRPSLSAPREGSTVSTSSIQPSTSYSYGSGSNCGSTSYSTTSGRPDRPGTRGLSVTSGRKSRNASSIGASEGHQVICAVSEARGVSPSVGVAFINISTGEAILSQISDTQFYIKTIHKLQVFEPSKILFISTSFPPNPKSSLLALVETHLPGVPIISLHRRYWSEAAGLDFVQALAFTEDAEAIKFALEGKFYATSAFSATVKYLELESTVTITGHSLRIRYQPSEDSMMIDLSTIHSLELLQNLQNAKSKSCLLGLLNHTLTPMGARTLRSNIVQPSTLKDITLTTRYDAIEELSSKEDMYFEIRKALSDFLDVERLLTKLVIIPRKESFYDSEQAINNVLKVKSFLQQVQPLFMAMTSARSILLTRVRQLCRPEMTCEILGMIAEVINDDVVYVQKPIDLRNQRTYAVRAGVHGLLDVARKTYKEATGDLHQHIQELNTELNLAGDLKFDDGRRYYLRFLASDFQDSPVPDVLINRVRKGDYLECQTLVLLKFNQRISDSVNEVVMQSDHVIKLLLAKIRDHVPTMFKICEGIAIVDLLASFSHLVITRDYVRPDLGSTLAIKDARHPMLEAQRPEKFIPNDYYATDLYRFQTITGCNMSGKSTYIKTIALLQVMAQIGCFVPAQYASFPIIHNLFARVSTDDCIEANMSTFSVEMREMAFILRNANDKTLAIIDELGRGTSTRDGLAIAIAIAEALVQSNAMVFFATHFTDLAKVLSDRPGVLNLHLATSTTTPDDIVSLSCLTMLYKISSGAVTEKNYGLKLASAVGFPASFMAKAEAVAAELTALEETKKRNSNARKLANRRQLVLALRETLVQASETGMKGGTLTRYLKRVQSEFVARMESLERGNTSDTTMEPIGSPVVEVDHALGG